MIAVMSSTRKPPRRPRGLPRPKGRPGVDTPLYQTAFHHSPAMQSVVRVADGVIVEVNDTFLKKLGFTRQEVIGRTAPVLNFWVDPAQLINFKEELERHGFVQGREVRLRASDGTVLTVLLSTHPVKIEGVAHFLSAGVDISARKLAEAELHLTNKRLRQSEERFSKIFRTSPALIVITRLSDGIFVAANEAFLRTTEFTGGEIMGRSARELNLLVRPDERDEFIRLVREKGSVRDREFVVRAKSGQLRTLLVSSELIEIDGAPHVQTVGLDISERKRAEEKVRASELQLRESEAHFSAAFQTSPVLMTIGRLSDEKFVEVNEAFLRLIGLERNEIVGRDSRQLQLWVDLGERAQFYQQLKKDRVLRNVECQIRSRDGAIHTMQISGEIIEINREPHLLTFALDITQRQKAERALRESEARFSTAFHATPVFTTIARLRDGQYVEANEAFAQWVGLERDQIVGRSWEEFAMWPNVEDGARFFAELQRTRSVRNVECQLQRRDGSLHTLLVSADIIEINGEEHILGFALNISDQKKAQAELQNALAREKELGQLKSDFVSLVSHEFRTPLEIIMSSVDNLARYHDRLSPEKREQLLRTINKSVRRMSMMMEEVLVLGRLETERMTFKPATLDLRTVCQRICDEIESATASRCPIHLEVDTQDPPFGDENVLRHILTNLLSNAVKYSPPGQPVGLLVKREGEDAVCRVIDHGCGIPEADQKRLFQAFHRGSNVRQIPGTGLGLLIVYRCVELHGGDIQFESQEGKGTTFHVYLPMK